MFELPPFFTSFVPGSVLLIAVAGEIFLDTCAAGDGWSRALTQLYGASGSWTRSRKGPSAVETVVTRGAFAQAAYRAETARDPAAREAGARLGEPAEVAQRPLAEASGDAG